MYNRIKVLLSLSGITCLIFFLMTTTIEAPIRSTGQGQITKKMMANAEVIYAGTASKIISVKEGVITIINTTTFKGQWKIAEFDVDHTVKGDSVKKISVEFFTEGPFSINGLQSVPLNKRCLLFLVSKKDAPEIYRLLDHKESSVVLLASDSPTDLPEDATPLEHLQTELFNAMMEKDQFIVSPALKNIVDLDLSNQQIKKALNTLSQNSNNAIKGSAIAARIRLREKKAIGEGKNLVESDQCPEISKNEISWAIRELKGIEYIEELKGLVESKKVSLRRAASYALRQTKDKSTWQILERMLKDSDTEVRLNAIMGLIEQTSKDNPEAYKKWERWWEENKDRFKEIGKK